ncbi:Excinuclease UvrABC, nuclease subunit (plasmid) [Nostoc flagelliforme CCNUN1]|uniref:Excinuclease UvrABC, nuclease subunit n=1 Tax=Nostoc flagelliforme CCNUN1 TaxID=2038116 RepID=A0A2K8T7I5_9NOSO|nr:GIY-YIG nuclease family protein [Nostoc flagelliforme]AUB43631.1 Excinuclease UvrABC, nuclease subunit [Nostoc flagelliforme CCNUN1]
MAINPATINPLALPSVSLHQRSQLPSQPCIYFAIDLDGQIQYIGRSINPKARWALHHKYSELHEIGGIRLSYLHIDDVSLLSQIEAALIAWFNPPLNQTTNLNPFASGMLGLRLRVGKRAEEIAVELGVAVSTVRNWDQLKTAPRMTPVGLQKLMQVYNCTFDELVQAKLESENV